MDDIKRDNSTPSQLAKRNGRGWGLARTRTEEQTPGRRLNDAGRQGGGGWLGPLSLADAVTGHFWIKSEGIEEAGCMGGGGREQEEGG